MSLLEFLNDVAKGIVEKAEHEENTQSSRNSTLPCGRMLETDNIKGIGSLLPNEPGMYRHRNKFTGEIEYVGQTNDLRRRQQEHARTGKLDIDNQYVQYGVAKSTASKDDLCKTEVEHITRHQPSGNSTKGGNGRR